MTKSKYPFQTRIFRYDNSIERIQANISNVVYYIVYEQNTNTCIYYTRDTGKCTLLIDGNIIKQERDTSSPVAVRK